jgi:hypothetical protein
MGNSGNYSYNAFIPNGTKFINCRFSSDGTGATQLNSTTLLTVETWYHYAIVCDGVNANLYINGVFDTSTAFSGNLFNSTRGFEVGNWGGSTTERFKGSMGSHFQTLTNLSLTQIQGLYNDGVSPYIETLPTSITDDLDHYWELSDRNDGFEDLIGATNLTAQGGAALDGELLTFGPYV